MFEDCYRTVHRAEGKKDSPLDFYKMKQDERSHQAVLEQIQFNDNIEAETARENYEAETNRVRNRGFFLERDKRVALNKMANKIPNMVLNEAFSRIFINALPHDKEYIEANMENLRVLSYLYLKKIGGMDTLKNRAQVTESAFLNKLYRVCNECSKEIITERSKKVMKSLTEDEIRKAIEYKPTEPEKLQIAANLDDLGADELAELVNNKVIEVVKDEHDREVTEKEFKDQLKDRTSPDTDTPDDSEIADEALNIMESYDPIRKNFTYNKENVSRTFFFSLMCGVTKDMMKTVTEGADASNKPVPQVVLENPLNMNIFDVFLQDKNGDLEEIEGLDTSNAHQIAGDVSDIDRDSIMTEALVQYTLLETAHTMKLIAVNESIVKQQSDFLVKG